jgi:hypothetical protein
MSTKSNASMRDIRAHLPQYFAANVPALVRALSDKGARVEGLALALVGGAIERAQSGNFPTVWLDVRAAADALKGGTKVRADKALAHVDGIAPGSVKGDVQTFETFAAALADTLRGILTPPAPKAKGAPVNWKARAEAAEAEVAALTAEVAALQSALAKAKAASKAPAPVARAKVAAPAPLEAVTH